MSIASKCNCGASLTYCNGSPECKKANLMFQAANELNRAADEIYKLRVLLRETAIRCQIFLPQSEEEEKWWNEACHHQKSGDFMLRLFKELQME